MKKGTLCGVKGMAGVYVVIEETPGGRVSLHELGFGEVWWAEPGELLQLTAGELRSAKRRNGRRIAGLVEAGEKLFAALKEVES